MNKHIYLGNLTDDFKKVETSTDMTIARGSIALNRGKDKDGNDRGADFPSLVAFGNIAENMLKYGKKGRRFLIEGHVQTGSYEKDGRKVYTTDTVIDRWEFADSKPAEQPQLGAQPQINDSEFMTIPAGIEEELPFF